MTWELAGEEETIALGAEVAADLAAGEVLALCGQLGAGKTHFSKGIVRGLGGDPAAVTSPTFTLVHEYSDGRSPVFHFDFYRMDSADEVLRIGWDEYLDDGEGVVLVEWADKFPELMPDQAQWWQFAIAGEGRRVQRSSGPPQP